MPLSFRCMIQKLKHNKQISEEECQKLLTKLEGHDREIRNTAIDELVKVLIERGIPYEFDIRLIAEIVKGKKINHIETTINKGCSNCEHQPEPLQTCDWMKTQTAFYTTCPMWSPKE